VLHLVTVGPPPSPVAGRHAGALLRQTDRPDDEFPDDIGLTGVPAGIGGDADQDVVQAHLVLIWRPPRHVTDGV